MARVACKSRMTTTLDDRLASIQECHVTYTLLVIGRPSRVGRYGRESDLCPDPRSHWMLACSSISKTHGSELGDHVAAVASAFTIVLYILLCVYAKGH